MFYERNKVLTMLEQKKIPLGIQCFTGNTELVEVMGATGLDFVMFDCVHSGRNVRAMEELVRTATLAGMASYIRVPDAHNETDVRRALEAGAEGVVRQNEIVSSHEVKSPANLSRPVVVAAQWVNQHEIMARIRSTAGRHPYPLPNCRY